MKIRDAKTSDAAILDEMLTQLIQFEKQWDQNMDSNYTVTDNYTNLIGQAGCKILIAENNHEICGYLCAFVHHPPAYVKPIVILDALFVLEKYRGQGCATALIDELKSYAITENAHAIELKVFSANISANRLYTHNAFTETKKYLHMEL